MRFKDGVREKVTKEGGKKTNEGWRESGRVETPTVTRRDEKPAREKHLVITKREDSWLGPSPLSTQKIYLSLRLRKPPHYHLFYHSIFPKARHDNPRRGRREGWIERGRHL